jgi:polyhydroxybutyrate depolymerase
LVLALAAVVLVLVLASSAAASVGSGPCSAAPAAGSYNLELSSGGLQRSALVHVPPGILAGVRVPLLLALHGAYGSGPRMQSYSGFSKLADRHRFIAAYPSAEGHFWNISAAANRPNDVAFISSLITALESQLCIDGARVLATGVSNGGGMVALLGCELSARLAAVAMSSPAPRVADRDPRHGRSDRALSRAGRQRDGRRASAVRHPVGASR